MPAPRRTQAERTEATTTALLAAARALFVEHGYEATSLDAVAAAAGMTKGAVYHHFDGKRRLFEAVLTQEVQRMTGPLLEAYRRKKDPWEAFGSACRAFLGECLDPGVQRIVLRDGFTALGWEEVRRLEQPLLELMEQAITRAVDAGRIARRPAAPLAHFLFGALCEAAMTVARADDPDSAHRQAVSELRRVLDGLVIG
ncbi:transcriptional regulator [Mycolicibacterium phlei]|jgi:AcrR family transcriptional regulator|uniref:TetR family transcriptional regulator n=1 Tax=Mycolicibacterium phlei DSM 43239 = CCUG 21000 TaxID=1226750 RepID=A0A5N5VAG2_MYCPH|nr:TetR/AcrR family transcriptional regulator [Mycolicibacterium phlei]VEG09879.1 transcriptional regulator [Mycobacteroides chelonae]AMO61772.1 Transposon Tn10 TetC protein [Mycolicibacterium phlei]EID11072.1 transcriptional regulator [Mycolicibacterium phlei RIVM601174]KAB7758758.1 TetR family transcriptional regulator [Mycolicibacterium phlei DSM 43239 = CCUG 21000]KXW67242.1 TetR family transcriptional regulator [Mycolicibacterium phlei DSM 43239 = CCUG 21000]